MLPGTAHAGIVECELGSFGVPAELAGEVEVVLRPESIAIGVHSAPQHHAEAVIVERAFFGHDQLLQLELPSGLRLRSRRLGLTRATGQPTREQPWAAGSSVDCPVPTGGWQVRPRTFVG